MEVVHQDAQLALQRWRSNGKGWDAASAAHHPPFATHICRFAAANSYAGADRRGCSRRPRIFVCVVRVVASAHRAGSPRGGNRGPFHRRVQIAPSGLPVDQLMKIAIRERRRATHFIAWPARCYQASDAAHARRKRRIDPSRPSDSQSRSMIGLAALYLRLMMRALLRSVTSGFLDSRRLFGRQHKSVG